MPFTYFLTKLIYLFTLRVTGINIKRKRYSRVPRPFIPLNNLILNTIPDGVTTNTDVRVVRVRMKSLYLD